jgi:hypothetical protein
VGTGSREENASNYSNQTEPSDMTKRRFAGRLAFAVFMTAALASPPASAQQAEPPAKPGKLINTGDVLSGELNTMKVRGGKTGKKTGSY